MSENYSIPKNAPAGYAEKLGGMSDEDLREEIARASVTVVNTKNALDEDPAVISARKRLDDAQDKYRGVIKEEDAKVQLCTKELSRRGFKGHPTEFDQISFADLQSRDPGEGKKEKKEGKGRGKGTRRTAPVSAVK